jgi:hypothetical protein
MQLRSAYQLVVFIALFGFENSLANAATSKQQCAPAVNAQKEVVGVTKKIFVAARADDLPALVAITTPDFYAYDPVAQCVVDFEALPAWSIAPAH